MDDRSFIIRVPKTWGRTALIVAVTALIVAPLTAVASHSFTDVPDTNIFHADIDWLKDSGVTKGCNPPANTLFCPKDEVTREQMAAFMNRLANNKVVHAATAETAEKAGDADTLDGKDSAEFVEGSQLLAVHAGGNQSLVVSTDTVVRQVDLTAPVAGTVIVTSTATGLEFDAGNQLGCSITTGTTLDHAFLQRWESGGSMSGALGQLAGTRGFDVTAGQTLTVNMVCARVFPEGSSTIQDSALTAIFIPNP
jgi:hypothetical protein